MKLYIISAALIIAASDSYAAAERTVSYARSNQAVTLQLAWDKSNYGTIEWQNSSDNGQTWTTVPGATSKSYTFRLRGTALYRALIHGDESCPPAADEREIRPVSFKAEATNVTGHSVDFNITSPDFSDAEIVEYGYSAAMNGTGRVYTTAARTPVGKSLPEGDSFTITCANLRPATAYSLRPYFITSDGSIIYGSSNTITTKAGVAWDNEGWTIEKSSLVVPFSVIGATSDATPEFWLGRDKNSLKKYRVNGGTDGHYHSQSIGSLEPGTEYIAVVKASVNGETLEIEKRVRTLTDYSTYTVDETVKPVSHVVEWDRTRTLRNLTPENLQVEYPRMCRVDDNTILFAYHGGASDYWQNTYLRRSTDNGQTWSDPITIYQIGNSFLGSGYWRICNPEMTRLQNGWIILTVVANGNPETNNNCKVLACLSKDGGQTWGDPMIVGRGRTWEPMVVQLPGGDLELLVSSEAAWYEGTGAQLQEIVSARSTDNGETWTSFKRASFKPGARDGMPVAVVMQGNKGVLFIEESVNGGISPSLVHRPLDGSWDTADWDGVEDSNRWNTSLNRYAGAPYMIQLATGEFLMMAHTSQTGDVWQTCRPQVVMADNTGHGFKYLREPLSGNNPLPAGTGAYYNSFFQLDDETVWLLITRADYNGSTRNSSDIMLLEGKIVAK